MNSIDSKLQEMKEEAMNESINRIAIHEAGHFVMALLQMREAPRHVIMTPEAGIGLTMFFDIPDNPAQHALIIMAGYAAEQLYDPNKDETGLGDYMYHDDFDNQDFLTLCREITGSQSLKKDSFLFELKSFQIAGEILAQYKSLLLAVALEIKNAKNFEMDYYAIKALCEKLQEEYPILKSVIFPDPASYDASEFQEEINSYKKMQADILGDPEADYPS